MDLECVIGTHLVIKVLQISQTKMSICIFARDEGLCVCGHALSVCGGATGGAQPAPETPVSQFNIVTALSTKVIVIVIIIINVRE